MPKRCAQVARDDAAGLDDEIGGQRGDDLAQRQMDGDRHDRELGRPQHHHRLRGDAGRLLRQLGEIFGVAGLGEARAIEHVLGDRIGDDGGGRAGDDVGDRAADRGDRRRRARRVRTAGLGGDAHADVDDRQRARERAPPPPPARPPRSATSGASRSARATTKSGSARR